MSALKGYRPPRNPLTNDETKALRELKQRTDIVILKADKGNSTVVLDRSDYDKKVLDIVEDKSTYQKLRSDPTLKVERELNKKLVTISKDMRRRFGSSDAICPRFYGLPKIHKPGCPLRPIVSYLGSPLYRIAQYLSLVLQPLLSKTYSVRNSSQFVKELVQVNPKQDDVFVSFDVVSLFPSVPPDLVLDIVKSLLDSTPSLLSMCLFTIDQMLDLLRFVLTSTAFSFKGVFYKQVSGTPMGSPISCVVADLAMEQIEAKAFKNMQVQPSFYRRFVDDSFAVLQEDQVGSMFTALNSVHSSFKFTMEKEVDGRLSFLDVLVIRNSSGISTTVYRKPTHTDRYLHFSSCQPLSHKASVVDTLLHRAFSVPSSECLQQKELSLVRRALLLNGYPSRFLTSRITTVRNRLASSHRPPSQPNSEPKKRIFLPYLPKVSEGLSRIIRKHNLIASFLPGQRISSFFPKVKDPVSINDVPGVVYSIPCSDCNLEYIGETGRRLRTRVREHVSDCRSSKLSTALSEHACKLKHVFDFSHAKVLHRCAHYHKRIFMEAWEIQCRSLSFKACCNSSSGKTTVPDMYLGCHTLCCCPQAALTMPQ
jgi:hypothetical protein